MTWQNPWAWFGLATLALPVVVHLLGRGRSRVHRFPTLRFIDVSRLLPSRRTRLHDLLLLMVRLAILLTAVAALARPTTANRGANEHSLARAIVIDTSASLQRATAVGERALLAARREATQLASESAVSTMIEVASPSSAIPGAVAWLQRQAGAGELRVISDFQVGSIDSAALAAVPRRLGVQLTRIATAPTAPGSDLSQLSMHGVTTVHVTPDTSSTDVIWTTTTATAPTWSIGMLAGVDQGALVAGTIAASRSLGLPLNGDSTHVVAIVFPAFPEIAQFRQRARPIHAEWMTTLATRLQRDPLLARAAAASASLPAVDAFGVAIAKGPNGAWVVAAAGDSTNGRERLLLFSRAEPGTVAAAALAAAVARANDRTTPLAELEPNHLSDAVLATWQRAPSADAPARRSSGEGASAARWFWLVVLLLLGFEWLIRTGARTALVTSHVTS